MARIFGVLFTLTVLLAGPASARDSLTIGMTQYPRSLHPSLQSMLAASYIHGATLRDMTIFNHEWELECRLCVKLPSLEDGSAEAFPSKTEDGEPVTGVKARYTIKEDIFWGDGTPVTVSDIIFSWEVGRHPESGVPAFKAYQDILAIEAHSEKSFTVTARKLDYRYQAAGSLPFIPAHLEREIFEAGPRDYKSRTLYQTDPTNPGLWNGPYRVARVEAGSQITLTRNEQWRGAKPAFKTITIKMIENTSALEANLLSGSVDMIAGELGLSLDQALAFENRNGKRYNVFYQPGLIYEHLDVNLSNPILSDVRVRQALIQAIDRKAISERLFQGKQAVANSMVNPLDWIYSAGAVPVYEHNPEAAKALLEAAGWKVGAGGVRVNDKGEKLSLSLMTTAGNRSRELIQQVLADYWKRVGIETIIKNEPARVFFGETVSKRRFPGFAMFAWLSAPESLPRTTLHSDYIPTEANNWGGQNFTGFSNLRVDELLDAMEIELDKAKRKTMWDELQKIYAEQLPAIPLYFRAEPHILPKWLKGLRPSGHSAPSTNWIEDWRVER